jgi:hypothetical protein
MPDPESIYLPDAGLAWIPEAKLHSYALNPDHQDGGHKARVFEADLALRRRDWAHLRDAILRALPDTPVHDVRERGDGAKSYTVIVEITGLNGRTARVTTGWYVAPGESPRLATVYIDKRHRR